MPRPDKTLIVGVTGGIGAGKSVVCRICALRGMPVYDCDREARRLMEESGFIRDELCRIAGSETVTPDGCIDRAHLASLIFRDAGIRREVNALVHAAVRSDIERWRETLAAPVAIVESAILHSSGLERQTDAIWLVTAPEDLRIDRACARSGLTPAQAKSRIEAQQGEFDSLDASRLSVIINDGATPMLPRIDTLLNTLTNHNNNA